MGYVVDFPIEFLSKEKNFYPSILTKQGIAPYELWTWSFHGTSRVDFFIYFIILD